MSNQCSCPNCKLPSFGPGSNAELRDKVKKLEEKLELLSNYLGIEFEQGLRVIKSVDSPPPIHPTHTSDLI